MKGWGLPAGGNRRAMPDHVSHRIKSAHFTDANLADL